MNLFLTGAGGFLGSRLAEQCSRRGHVISGTSRKGGAPRTFAWNLRDPFDTTMLRGAHLLIHCAYDRDASIEENIEGTKRAVWAGEQAGVDRQIFVSSYSARPDSAVPYGRIKYALETFFLERGHTVARPGLVAGNGGMFGRNLRQVLHTPVVPLLDGGRDLIPIVGVKDFVDAMVCLIEQPHEGAHNLFCEKLITMRMLVETINRKARHHALCVPVPARWAERLLGMTRSLRIPLPVDADNLRALKQNQKPIHRSGLAELVAHPLSPEAAIESAVAEYGAGTGKAGSL